MRTPTWMLIAVVTLSSCSACNEALPDALKPESQATVIPGSADVVAGSRHDVLVVACVNRVNWLDVLTPFVVAAFFVSVGRIDAAFYVPGAVASALIPECGDADFEVDNARVDGDGFSLEPTDNPALFHLDAGASGSGVFRADVVVNGELIGVEATFRAQTPNEVALNWACPRQAVEGYDLDPFMHERGSEFSFQPELAADGTPLAGYQFELFDPSDTIAIEVDERGAYVATFVGPRGPASLRSSYDPNFEFAATVIEPSDYTELTVVTGAHRVAFVGEPITFDSMVAIDGVIPCTQTRLDMMLPTPAVCDVPQPFARDFTSLGLRQIDAVSPGTCTVELALPEAGLSATYAIEVHPNFETVEVGNIGEATSGHALAHQGEFYVGAIETNGKTRRAEWTFVVLYTVEGVWQRQVVDQEVYAFAAADGHVFALTRGQASGEDRVGVVWEFDGTTWTDHRMPGETENIMRTLSARAANDVWIVGAMAAFHYDGIVWSRLDVPEGEALSDVWAAPNGATYVLGNTLYRVEDDIWVDLLRDLDPELGGRYSRVTGTDAGGLWLSGDSDNLLHWDGTSWQRVELRANETYNFPAYTTVWPVPGTDELFVFNTGTNWIGHFDGDHFLEFDKVSLGAAARGFTVDGNSIVLTDGRAIQRLTYVP